MIVLRSSACEVSPEGPFRADVPLRAVESPDALWRAVKGRTEVGVIMWRGGRMYTGKGLVDLLGDGAVTVIGSRCRRCSWLTSRLAAWLLRKAVTP